VWLAIEFRVVLQLKIQLLIIISYGDTLYMLSMFGKLFGVKKSNSQSKAVDQHCQIWHLVAFNKHDIV